jgi:transglutaminase-like putative cysteine protease
MYRLIHRTHYRYTSPVDVANHVACLRPRELSHQHVLDFDLHITPQPAMFIERTDYFGNTHQIFSIQSPHRELIVRSRALVEVLDPRPEKFIGMIPWESVRDSLPEDHSQAGLDAYQFSFESQRVPLRPGFADYALESFTPRRPLREALLEFTARIHKDFKFKAAATNMSTTVDEVFLKRVGVCQDFAHLEIACLRSLGLAARYVSGYLRTYPPPGQERAIGADASHAWLSVYCPGKAVITNSSQASVNSNQGSVGENSRYPGSDLIDPEPKYRGPIWLDVDPTNNCEPGDGHITLAWGRDYSDVSPLRGLILGGGSHTLKVGVDVEPLEEPTFA